MELQQLIVLCVFGAAVVLASARVVHPAAAALAAALGLVAWLGVGILSYAAVLYVLMTTAGVMVLAGFMKRSGLVAWLALAAARSAKGRPVGILVRTGLLAFAAGALFGPAGAALILPVVLLLAVELDVPAVPFAVIVSWCSVLGGATVLTAQPGNLWLGSTLSVDGDAWLPTVLPLSGAALAATLLVGALVFRKQLRVTNERRARILEYDVGRALEDRPLLIAAVVVLVLIVAGLVLEPLHHVSPVVFIVGGALVLTLLTGRSSVSQALGEIDGGALLWYGGLFAVIAILAATGGAAWLAGWTPDPPILFGIAAVAGAVTDPQAVTAFLAPMLAMWKHSEVWPLAVLGAAIGGGVTLWGARILGGAAILNTAFGPRGAGWPRYMLWSLLFAAVNLAVVGGLWVLIPRTS